MICKWGSIPSAPLTPAQLRCGLPLPCSCLGQIRVYQYWVGCPQSKEEQVVGYSFTSDWDSLLLLIMLCFLEGWVLLGAGGECMKSMDTSKTSGLRCRQGEGKDKKVE